MDSDRYSLYYFSFFIHTRALSRKKQKETKAIRTLPDCLPSIAAKTGLSSPRDSFLFFRLCIPIFSTKILYLKDFCVLFSQAPPSDTLFQPIIDKEKGKYWNSEPDY